jgi:heparanase 1
MYAARLRCAGAVLAALLVCASADTRVAVDAGAAPLATTSRAFLGVNIDSASLYQGARLDFGDADLRALATRLARAKGSVPKSADRTRTTRTTRTTLNTVYHQENAIASASSAPRVLADRLADPNDGANATARAKEEEGDAGGDGVGMAAAAARMTLRLGGSAADDLSTFVNDTRHGQIFLDAAYWDELTAFADACGFDLAWDLNMRVGRSGATNGTAAWDPVDARRLLERVQARKQRVWAYQLGNEPGHWQTRNGGDPNATNHGRDFRALAALLQEGGRSSNNSNNSNGGGGGGGGGGGIGRPRIMGPDVCFGAMTDASPCADATYFRALLVSAGPSTIDDITVHAYGLTGPKGGRPANETNCFVADFLNRTEYRQRVVPVVAQWQRIAREIAPGANLVLSETATAADGGCPGLSNSFVAGFYFVDILGELAAMGVHQVYRQDLVGFSGIGGGSSYALLGDPGWYNKEVGGRLAPNPDYFTALLYRTLVASQRLPVKVTTTSVSSSVPGGSGGAEEGELVAYAACAVGGGIVISFLNPGSSSIVMAVSVTGGGGGSGGKGPGPLDIYMLTAPGGNLTSRGIELNGKIMTPDAPLVPQKGDSSRRVKVPAHSYGFVVDRAAKGKHCGY